MEKHGLQQDQTIKGQQPVSEGEIKLNTMSVDRGFLSVWLNTSQALSIVSVHQHQTSSQKIWHKNALQKRPLLLSDRSGTLDSCQGQQNLGSNQLEATRKHSTQNSCKMGSHLSWLFPIYCPELASFLLRDRNNNLILS